MSLLGVDERGVAPCARNHRARRRAARARARRPAPRARPRVVARSRPWRRGRTVRTRRSVVGGRHPRVRTRRRARGFRSAVLVELPELVERRRVDGDDRVAVAAASLFASARLGAGRSSRSCSSRCSRPCTVNPTSTRERSRPAPSAFVRTSRYPASRKRSRSRRSARGEGVSGPCSASDATSGRPCHAATRATPPRNRYECALSPSREGLSPPRGASVVTNAPETSAQSPYQLRYPRRRAAGRDRCTLRGARSRAGSSRTAGSGSRGHARALHAGADPEADPAPRGAFGDARRAGAGAHGGVSRPSRAVLRRRRRSPRRRHAASSAASWDGRAPRGRCRTRGGRRARAGRRRRRVLRGSSARPPRRRRPRDGVLPAQQRRGDRGGAARTRRAGARSSTGTRTTATARKTSSSPIPTVLYVSMHEWPLYPGHRPARRHRGRARAPGRP